MFHLFFESLNSIFKTVIIYLVSAFFIQSLKKQSLFRESVKFENHRLPDILYIRVCYRYKELTKRC